MFVHKKKATMIGLRVSSFNVSKVNS